MVTMKILVQAYKFFVVSLYLLRQYFNILFSPADSKDFFTMIYIKAIANNNHTKFFGKGIPRKELGEIFPNINKTNIFIYAHYGSLFSGDYSKESFYLLSPNELFTLSALVKYLEPSKIFEFGTAKGWTVSNLIQNVSPLTQVYTLDILENESDDLIIDEILSRDNAHKLLGDSIKFDFSAYYKKMDFVFIDACHSEAAVKKDTESALGMLTERGVIVWHDFNPKHPGVFKYLHELEKELPIYSIKNTAMVVYVK